MATALVALATTTLASNTTTVTFSSISSAYRDLRLVISGTVNATTNLSAILNGDSSAAYSRVYMGGNGSTTSSSSFANADPFIGYWEGGGSNNNMIIDFMDYSATDKHKTALSRANNPAAVTWAWCYRWGSTNAISSIAMSANATTWATGTTFSLFGIVSA